MKQDQLTDNDLVLCLYRIISGKIRCRVGNCIYYIYSPTPFQLYEAGEIYNEVLIDSQISGVMTDDEFYDFMIRNNLWNYEKEKELLSLPDTINSLKYKLWESYINFRGKQCDNIRVRIHRCEDKLQMLTKKRYQYSMYTASGIAALARIEYLISNNVYCNNKRIDITDNYVLLKELVNQYFEKQIPDNIIRRISKLHTWRSMWMAGKSSFESLGICASCMTDEQKSLISWSKLYDNIYESIDCPPENVIDDDYLLDGWIIAQNKKREEDRKEKLGQKHKDKMHGSSEVFIPVETHDDIKRVSEMNSPHARAIQKQRFNLLKKYGKVREQDMPDSKIIMQQQAIRQGYQRMKEK